MKLNILFVCLGNICRSPLAAGIMRQLYEQHGYTGVIESAGTVDWQAGSPADRRAVKVALENGIDIRDHRARQIRVDDFRRFDLIVVMDRDNHRDVIKLAPEEARGKVRRLLEQSEGQSGDVADPYHGDERMFRSTFQLIHSGCSLLAAGLGGK